MSNQFLKLRRSAVPGKIPDTGSLDLGEIALNTYDGVAFMKKSVGGTESIVTIGNTTGSFTGSFSGEFTGSLLGTASWAYNAVTASTADNFYVRGDITGSNALITGTLTAQRLVVQTISSSVIYSSGSNIFGDELTDTQQFTGSVTITGSLTVNGPSTFNGQTTANNLTGSLFGTSSWATNAVTASHAVTALSSSYAVSASNASTASFAQTGNGTFSGSFSGSFFGNGAGITNISASSVVGLNLSLISSGSVTASTDPAYGFRVNANSQFSGSTQITGSLGVTGSVSISGSIGNIFSANVDTMVFTGSLYQTGSTFITGTLSVFGGITGSLFGTSSWAVSASHAPSALTASYAISSSYSFNSTTASHALTASSADNFLVRQDVTASNALITGTLTAQTIIAQYITSSTEFITGSTKFGTQLTDTHQFTGSVTITGSLSLNNDPVVTQGPYNTFSQSIQLRATNLESTASILTSASASFAQDSGSNSIRLTNLESTASVLTTASASFAIMSASYASASGSLSTRVTTLENASASFAQDSGSNSVRLTNLESTASVLTQASASFSSSISYLSSSFTAFSQSYNTGSFTGSFFGQAALTGSFSGSFSGTLSGSFSGSVANIDGQTNYIAKFDSPNSIDSSVIYQSSSFIAINETNFTAGDPEALYVFQTHPTSFNVVTGKGNTNNYLQLNIQNTNQGISASSDIVATANNGNEFSNYIDMGINSENFNTGFIGEANDAYVYSIANNLHIGNAATNGSHLGFFVGGDDVQANNKLQLNPDNIHFMSGSLQLTGSLNVLEGITGSLFGTASWAISASHAPSALTSSYAITASYSLTATSASHAINSDIAISASYAATASSANDFLVRQNITASNALITGTLTAQTIIAQYITSSTEFITGSTKFGTQLTDTHQFTGSVTITGSLALNNDPVVTLTPYNTFSSSIQLRATNLESTASVLTSASASFAQDSGSNSIRFTNLESTASVLTTASASFAIVSASYSSASGSLSTRVTNLESTASVLTLASASFAVVSGSYSSASSSLSIRTTDLESTSSVLTSASASFAQQSGSNSIRFTNLESTASVLTQASASFALVSSSYAAFSSSYNTGSFTGSFTGAGNLTGSLFGTSSWAQNATTASHAVTALSSSYAISSSYSLTATTASHALTTISASYAATASSADNFLVRQNVTASNALITGTLTAQTIIAQYITSSTEFITGSTKFGSQLTDTHQFTGSVTITGSLSLNNSPVITDSTFTPFSSSVSTRVTNLESTASVLTTASASFALVSASYSAFSSSYNTGSFTGSFTGVGNLTGSLFGTASWAQNAVTSSYILQAVSASFATTASYAVSSSYAYNADLLDGKDSSVFATTGSNVFVGDQIVTGSLFTSGSNTLVGSTTLTGSLNVTGSTIQTGNNTLIGNTTLSGSIIISGSSGPGSPTASVQIYGDIRQAGYHRFDPVTTNINNSISASYIYVSGSTNDLYFTQNGAGYGNTTRLRWIEGNLYTGLLNGGLITTQSSTVYQVSSGSGIIVDLNASLNDNPYPTVQYLNWPNLTGSISAFTSSYQQLFVGIDNTNNLYAQGTPFYNGQVDTLIPVGDVFFQNGSTINGVKTAPGLAYGWKQRSNVFISAFGPLKLSGFTLAASGSSTGSLIIGSGTAFADGQNYTVDPDNPSYIIDSGTNVSKIFRYYQSGSTWVYQTNAGAGFGAIDPANYSNNGTLTGVGAGNWSIQRVFWFPNSVTKAIVVYYGNAIYATEAEAIANLSIESFVEAPNTAANAVYVGSIVISGNGVFTNTSTFTILPGGLFRQVGGSGGGGSVVTQTLAGLSDVSISGPTNGQPLVYNSTSGKWENSSTLVANLTGNASTATTASFAVTASYILNAVSASYALSASSAEQANTASYVLQAVSASFATTASFASQANTASYVLQAVSASFASNASTASYVLNAVSASYALNATTASHALTASSADNFLIRQNVTASNALITGTLTAQTIIAQYITSSTEFITGSTKFGTLLTDTHQFTGSVTITGSLSVNNSPVVTNATFTPFSSSVSTRVTNLESTASVLTTASASFAQQSGSNSIRLTNLETTASVLTTASASFALVSASYSSASGSLSTRVTNLETTSSVLTTASASFAQQSGSNSIRLTNLETTASVLTVASASFAIVSASYSALSGSFRTGSYTGSFTGTLFGTASWANNAVTSSYVLNAVSASFASTASYVNTLNQNVIITGSLTVGQTSLGANENTLVLGPSPAGGAGEGGQLLLAAPGGTYTSASMWDNYQNQTRLLRGTNAGSDAIIANFNMHTRQVQFPSYNSTTAFTGTVVGLLAFDSNGNVLTTTSSANLTGGSTNYVARWASATTLTTGSIYDNGTNVSIGNISPSYKLDVTGDIRATNAIYANANGAMYFRGGDDAELWDINVANTLGVYGQQNADRAGIKLGSSGPTLFGSGSNLGIGTITPTLATLQVSGNVYANSFTGSLFGTASWANNAVTSSYVLNAISASYAATASSADNFLIRQNATASNLLVNNTITAQTLIVQTVTSSIVYSSGSNIFGSQLTNVQQMTGSLRVTGSGNHWIMGGNVGIDTRTPAFKVDINGNARVLGGSTYLGEANVASGHLNAYELMTFNIDIDNDDSNRYFAWYTNAADGAGTELMRLTEAGKAGFSNNNPQYTVDITGDANVTANLTATGSIKFPSLTSTNQVNVVGYDTATGQLFYQTTSSLSVTSASYAATSSYATTFTIQNQLYFDQTLTDYASIASSVAGSNNLFTQATGSYTSAFFKYTVSNSTNARTGEVLAVWNGGSVQYTDNSTLDIGTTTPVTCSVSLVGGDVLFNVQTNTSGWRIKSIGTFM
jgi:hypothetical protein